MNLINRIAIIASLATLGLAACGDDAKSPAPVATQVTTPTSEAMMTPSTDAMMTPTTDAMAPATDAMMPATTEAMMGDASTTTTGG